MFSLKNKKAVITGAGSGIGKAMALLFAQQGAEVYVLDISLEAAQAVVSEVAFENLKAVRCDVSNRTSVQEVFAAIGEHHILINNAGIAHVGNAENTAEEDFDRIVNVNIKGVYNCINASIPFMKKAGGGAIINMASIAAWVGIPDRFAYSTAKGAVAAMTLSVAKDFLQENIRCNSISPARVHTPFVDGFIAKNYPDNQAEMFEKLSKTQPIGRMAKPEEVATLALYLASDEAGFITGCDYPLDGGFIKLNN